MSQKDIEVILLRQLASYLATPVFIVDPQGNLIFYNEPAEKVLGRRFDETGEMPAAEWGAAWTPTDENGDPLPAMALPLSLALVESKPSCRRFWIGGLDGVRRHIEVVAFPLIGQAQRHLGATVIFSEVAP